MDISVLEKQLGELIADQKTFTGKAAEELKTLGAASAETTERLDALKKQVDAIDEKLQSYKTTPSEKSFETILKENEGLQRLMKDGRGRASIKLIGDEIRHVKTTLITDNVGSTPRQTTGVMPIERTPGIVAEARRTLRLRSLLASRPTSFETIDYVKVANALADAAYQSPEGAAKSENAITFTSASERVQTIATFMRQSRQILSDWSELQSFLQTGLGYYTEKEAEDQLLFGIGGLTAINGLYTQATAFNTALLPGGGAGTWTPIDIAGWAAAQVAIADEIEPTFIIMNPADLWEIRMTKDTQGRYILGDPWSSGVPTLFGMTPVATTLMTQGLFMIGSGSSAANEIRTRMELEIAISTEDADNFTKNLVTIRAEERLAQVTYRPASFIKGSFVGSPVV